jgi:hypothetical protein
MDALAAYEIRITPLQLTFIEIGMEGYLSACLRSKD